MNQITHAVRQLKRRPGLSLVVIVILALGIGATTAIFSAFHQILVQPLPVPEPERLVYLGATGPKPGPSTSSAAGDHNEVFSYPMFRDLEARQSVFTGIAGHRDFQANIAYEAGTTAGRGIMVSGSYFDVLRLSPALGRLIGRQDEPRVDESPVVVLTYDYWQSTFGGDPSVIGRGLTVNGQALTVIGVAPEGFTGTIVGFRPQVFVPLTLRWRMEPTRPRDQENRLSHWVYLFARLGPQVTLEQASAEIGRLYGGIIDEVEVPLISGMPDDALQAFRTQRMTVEPGARGQSRLPEDATQPLTLLLGVTTLVLLIVCVNVANLLLARGVSRAGEMAIRASIGASRGRLMRQLLTEASMLALIGGFLSLPVAAVTLGIIAALIPAQLAEGLTIALRPMAVLFAGGASLSALLLFGVLPAMQATRTEPGLVMKGQASQGVGGRGLTRLRGALATAQIAFSMVLLVLAGLFAQSLANVARVNLGIDVDSLVTFTISPRMNGYTPEGTMQVLDRLEEELAAQAGVTAVGSARIPLLRRRADTGRPLVEGGEVDPGADDLTGVNSVSPGFLRALSIPLLAGRNFDARDTRGAPRAALVNETFTRRFKLGGDAVGKRIGFGSDRGLLDIEIVGVVADATYSVAKSEIPPQVFLSRRQRDDLDGLTFYVRSSIGADAMMRTIARVASSIDPRLPVDAMGTMQRQVEDNVYLDRLVAMLSTSLAALATLLAAIGLYGVLAYNVAQRMRELGLRLALGAEPGSLRRMVLQQVGLMAAVGGAVGLAAAIGLGRVAEALLFGITGYDPTVLVAAVLVLAGVVLGAGYLPARRAGAVQAMEALRHE